MILSEVQVSKGSPVIQVLKQEEILSSSNANGLLGSVQL